MLAKCRDRQLTCRGDRRIQGCASHACPLDHGSVVANLAVLVTVVQSRNECSAVILCMIINMVGLGSRGGAVIVYLISIIIIQIIIVEVPDWATHAACHRLPMHPDCHRLQLL